MTNNVIIVLFFILVGSAGVATNSSCCPSGRSGSLHIAAETRLAKLRRLAAQAVTSNPLDSPLAVGVTMTITPRQMTSLTKSYLPTTTPDAFAVHGGTPTVFSQTYWYFPVSDQSPDVHGNVGPFGTNKGLDAWGWEVEFTTDAPLVMIKVFGYASPQSNFRVITDDHYVIQASTTFAVNGGISYIELDFAGVRRDRHIQFRSMLGNLFGGVLVDPQSTVSAPSQTDVVKVVVTGDSYTDRMGYPNSGTIPDGMWSHVLANDLGWRDVRQVAVGATGYLNDGGTRLPIQGQIPRWIGLQPDVVVFAAGYNDNPVPAAPLTAAALLAFRTVRAGLPKAMIVVLGPWAGSGGQSATTLAKEAAIAAAFRLFDDGNSFFIPQENIAAPWLTGTGYIGHANGIGNADTYISADGIHPSDAGYAYLGHRAASAIRKALDGVTNKSGTSPR